MILVYCEDMTPRHRYIFDFLLEDVMDLRYALTRDSEEYVSFTGPKFSYGSSAMNNDLHFAAHPLLSETGIRQQALAIMEWEKLPVFFKVDMQSALPFDPFAMIFYLVTRYEEYLPFRPDEHGRFPATASLAFREGFLNIPLVNILAWHIKSLLHSHFPGIPFSEARGCFFPTFDIDLAYAHLGKGFARASAAWLKLLLQFDFGQMKERFLTLTGRTEDPFDNFSWQLDVTTRNGLRAAYFVLLGDFHRYDRNISHTNSRFRKLLEWLSRHADVGIHPSYQSYLNKESLLREKNRLEEIIGNPVTRSRFHFLRLKFPDSFRILLESGITDDYSLGYSTHAGYRAGTSVPFYFFDLEKEARTSLLLHPFAFMDTAMIDHMDYSPREALAEMVKYLELSGKFGGETIGVWHNYALCEKGRYAGWRMALEQILEECDKPSL